MFIREEQYSFAMTESPVYDRRGIGRGTYNTAITPTKGFEVGRRVHIGHGNNASVFSQCLVEHLPAFLNFGNVRHIGHGAARGRIGQDDALVRGTENIGTFSHEMHAAKHDVVCPGTRRGQLRELKRVTAKISVLDDLITLVVMPKDDKPLSQFLPGLGNTPV
jgi:hypothetical protein